MSLNSLADEEVARAKSLDQGPTDYTATVTAPLATANIRVGELSQGGRRGSTGATNALGALARYVPGEIVTLYVAALSAMPAITATFRGRDRGQALLVLRRAHSRSPASGPRREATRRRIQRLPILEGLAVVEAGGVDGGISRLGARGTRHPVPRGSAGQGGGRFRRASRVDLPDPPRADLRAVTLGQASTPLKPPLRGQDFRAE
jgi:hypothetical protein